MKKLLVSLSVLLLAATSFAQNEKYINAMKANFSLLDSAKTSQDLIAVAAAFQRVGDAEKTQWLPYYYAGLALSQAGWLPQLTDKDKNAEQIKAMCDKADAISPSSETYTLRFMAATQQMQVDPQSRWQTYGTEMATTLQKGMQLDPNNPRLYYLQGMNVFNTPENFGGGKAKAKPVFEKAVALYKTEQAQPNKMYPHWGQKEAEAMLAKCQ